MDIIAQYRWRPGIGDPSFLGWFTVFAYAVAAFLAASTARRIKPRDKDSRVSRQIWVGVAVLMGLLCVNKQLDLQTLFTDIGRFVAQRGGWYENRRWVQGVFVLVVIGAALAGGVLLVAHGSRAFWVRYKLLIGGLVFLLTFIVVRAISLHQFDLFNQSHILGMRVNGILELTGIFLVGLAAWRARGR